MKKMLTSTIARRKAYPRGRVISQMIDWSAPMSAGVLAPNTPKQ